ncbi:MAG: DUF3786 domain-containing protein [Clostridiales bacterium]|nr:DUF3786 domain-containing protein [Clostridiales bacterium]
MEKPEIKNNRYGVPMEHYLSLYRDIDPQRRAEELGLPYADGVFSITMYGNAYRISWPDGAMTADEPKALVSDEVKIMLLRYLISGMVLPSSGTYMAFPQLPGAAIYTATYNGRCIRRAAYRFGSDLDGLKRAAEKLGGKPVSNSDAGYDFAFLGNYHVQMLIWEGDDEFPPNAQFLYTDNFAAGFSAEDGVVAAEILITALGILTGKPKKA